MMRMHRSATLIVGCSLALFASAFFVLPYALHAEYEESNSQCPAGGQVGQKCKDNTNGFITDGHCTHINECTADKWPGPPSNNVPPKQPPGVPNDRYQQQPPDFSGSVSNTGDTAPSSGVHSSLINDAYSDSAQSGDQSGAGTLPENIVAINGIDYIILGSERLRFGDALTEAPQQQDPGAPDPNGLGNVGGIGVDGGGRGQGDGRAPSSNGGMGAFSNTFGAGSDVASRQSSVIDSIFPIGEETVRYAAPPFGIGFLALAAAIFLYFHKGSQMPLPKSQVDPTELAKKISTKDASVATPILTGVQEEPIWDTHYMPGDEEGRAGV